MGNAEEWARSLGEEIQSKQRVDRDIAQTVAMNRDIEAEKMPHKWEGLIEAFNACCIAYNEQVKPERKLALQRTGSHQFSIRPDAQAEIIAAKYDPHTRWIEIKSSGGRAVYFPQVTHRGSGDVELTLLESKTVKEPAAIAQDTLRECLICP